VYSDFDNSTSLLHNEINNVIVVKSMSKSLGLAGFRVGFCVGNKDIIDHLQNIRPLYICTKSSEIVVSNVITMTKAVTDRMQLTKSILSKNFSTVPSSANYVLFKEPNIYTQQHGAKEVNGLYRMALADRNTLCL
jgi:histidinol-phosphate aminotransferase